MVHERTGLVNIMLIALEKAQAADVQFKLLTITLITMLRPPPP